MEALATLKSQMTEKPIYFGIIDGPDSARLVEAYHDLFPGPGDPS